MADRLTFQPAAREGATPLRDVSFRLESGGAMLVAGPTGSGKSTLLRLIAGLGGLYPDPHAAGRLQVTFAGDDPAATDSSPLPSPHPGRVVLVPQSPRDALVGLDVFSALAMPLEQGGVAPAETTRRVEEALDRAGLSALMERDVASLSSGEARRVALAGVLAQDAPLVLLDEPFADLEPLSARRLRADLAGMVGRRTVVIAEHRPRWVQDLMDVTLHLVSHEARPAGAMTPSLPECASAPRTAATPGVEARGLGVRRAGRTLMKDVDLRLRPGVWGLIGPNGAGKTSLIWTLAGLLRPQAGSVDVAGVPVWRAGKRVRPRRHERPLRSRLQVAFQEPREAFFSNAVHQELQAPLDALGKAGKKANARSVQEALVASGRTALGDRCPQRLSGGEQRFVQLLGALLARPRVLLLDEPAHGLDADLRTDLRALLGALAKQGHLVLVATHEPEVLPADARWLDLAGDGRLITGAQAAPGAREPAAAGFTTWGREPSHVPTDLGDDLQAVRA